VTSSKDLARDNDRHLVSLALQGDERASSELVARYREYVFIKAFNMLGDWDAADSVTAETFRRAFDALTQHDSQYSFASWLARITERVALSRLEKRKLDTLPIEDLSVLDSHDFRANSRQVADSEVDQLQKMLVEERDGQIVRALPQLTTQQREVFLLFTERFTHEEIAQKLGMSVDASRAHLSRACKALSRIIRKQEASSSISSG